MTARTMIALPMAAFILLLYVFIAAGQTAHVQKGYSLFEGAWFDILYPEGFAPRVSLVSNSSGEGKAESAFFRSPGGEVEFYVFSPQWSGVPVDIALDPATEIEKGRTSEKDGDKTITLYTIQAKNGSYSRSYRDTKTENTRCVTGIKYRDKKAYNKYRNAYLRFRTSLVQYAD